MLFCVVLGGISIHALRKESDGDGRCDRAADGGISIHALRKESDRAVVVSAEPCDISIHALRKESDPSAPPWRSPECHFNPRSP